MNTALWFEKHLSEERMIGLLDGELSGRATQSAERHLKSCWSCRHKCEQIRLAMNQFIEMRETLMSTPAAQPPCGWNSFDGRLLRAEAAPLARRSSATKLPIGRPLLAPAALGLVVSMLVWFLHGTPLSAEEVLERSSAYEAAVLARAGKAVIVQDLKIESRNRVARVSVWRAPSILRAKSFWDERGDAGVKSELEAIYRRAGQEWIDPISAANHTRWEAFLKHHSEEVHRSGGTVRVIARNHERARNGEITEAELVVRAADWSPIEERLEVNNGQQEYRIIQTAYRVENSSTELGRMYEILSAQEIHETRAARAPGLPSLPDANTPPFRPVNLADSEIEALSLLHLIKADQQEAASVTRRKSEIVVEAYISDKERKGLIERMLSPVKSVSLVLHSLSSSQEAAQRPRAPQAHVAAAEEPAASRDPALLKPLVEQTGLMEIASDLVSRRLESIADLRVQLKSLERLSSRFPEDVRGRLTTEARHRLDALAQDYLDGARRAWREWEMSAGSFQSALGSDVSPASTSALTVCGPWENEKSLATSASRLQDLFSQGFTSTSGTSQPDSDLSGEAISAGIHQLSADLSYALLPGCLR